MRISKFVCTCSVVLLIAAVGCRLKIGEKMVTPITPLQTADSRIDLRGNRLDRLPAAGTEAAAIAVDTPPGGHSAVDIRAGHARVKTDFLDSMPKLVT